MIRLDEFETRLVAKVPVLAGMLFGAVALGKMLETDFMPVQQTHGYVVLGGLRGGQPQYATGWFHQPFMETISLFLAERHAGDATGQKALKAATPLIREIIRGICGWCPGEGTDDEAVGVFQLVSAEPVGFKPGGLLLSEIQFALNDQLRIQNP